MEKTHRFSKRHYSLSVDYSEILKNHPLDNYFYKFGTINVVISWNVLKLWSLTWQKMTDEILKIFLWSQAPMTILISADKYRNRNWKSPPRSGDWKTIWRLRGHRYVTKTSKSCHEVYWEWWHRTSIEQNCFQLKNANCEFVCTLRIELKSTGLISYIPFVTCII